MNTNGVDHDGIEEVALQVLEANNITQPVVDVKKIAESQGYKIQEIKMPDNSRDVAGFHDQSKKIIYIAEDDTPQRKLFTIAHELGHIFLEHPNYSVLFRIPKKDAMYNIEEKAANSFAAHLLMPEFMLQEYMKKYNLTKADYQKMALIFGVPLSAMKNTLPYVR